MATSMFSESFRSSGEAARDAHYYRVPVITTPPREISLKYSNASSDEGSNSQQAPTRSQKRRPHPSCTCKWWICEILSQIGGMLCLMTIIIILWHADGKPAHRFFWNITLNTLLAFLTSLTKVAFLVPVVEGLGQLKWIWFSSSKRRPVIDFQIFDEGTRGGIGTLKLLFSFKGFLTSFGAIIMLSGLFTSTLTQQAISYKIVNTVSSNINDTATIDRVTALSIYDGSNSVTLRPYDTVLEQQAIFSGVTTPPTDTIEELRPNCTSTKCTWPLYGSLAVCGGVANLTALGNEPLLQKLHDATEKRLDVFFQTANITAGAAGFGGFFKNVLKAFPIVVGLLDQPTGAFNESVTGLIVSDSFIAYTDETFNLSTRPFDMSKIKYLEIALWVCTKTYQTEVTLGQATTIEVATLSMPQNPATGNDTMNIAWDSRLYLCGKTGKCNDTYGATEIFLSPPPGLPPNSTPETYSVHLWSALFASHLIAATMLDTSLLDPARAVVASNGGGVAKAFGYTLLGDVLAPSVPSPEVQLRNLRTVVDNIARSMTNLLRNGKNKFGRNIIVKGTVYTPQSFVKVHWQWLAMLATQLLLTAVFLGVTVVITYRSRMQILKTSSLATLYALDEGVRREAGEAVDLEELQRWAKGVRVRLDSGQYGQEGGRALAGKVRRGG